MAILIQAECRYSDVDNRTIVFDMRDVKAIENCPDDNAVEIHFYIGESKAIIASWDYIIEQFSLSRKGGSPDESNKETVQTSKD